MRYLSFFGTIFGLFVITGCQNQTPRQNSGSKIIGMPNPASVYCDQLHGKSQNFTSPEGEYSICNLPNGEKIEEWALYYRDHPSPRKE